MNRIIYLAAVLLPVGLSSEEEMPTLLELIKELFAFDVSGYENLNFGTGILTGLRGLIIALNPVLPVLQQLSCRIKKQIRHQKKQEKYRNCK